MTDATTWPGELYDLLRSANVTQIAHVPDVGHKVLIDRSLADEDAHSIPLTTASPWPPVPIWASNGMCS